MISSKPKFNLDGSVKTTFNPNDYVAPISAANIDLSAYPMLYKDNIFTANNTFNNITAAGTITSPNISTLSTNITTLSTNVTTLSSNLTTLTDTVNTLSSSVVDYNSVLNITAVGNTTIPVATILPNVIFANVAAGNKTVFLPTLSSTYTKNYNGRTFVVHCHDDATTSGNSLTVRAGSSSQYMNQFGTNITSGRVLTAGSVQRYYTMNGLYYEV